MTKKNVISVLGDGGWGTALAILLERKENQLFLWSAFPEYAQYLNQKRENTKFLPGVTIPPSIKISSEMKNFLPESEILILAVPTKYLRNVVYKLKEYNLKEKIIISVAKGIEQKTLLRPSEIIRSLLGDLKIVVLSGPSHAEEVARQIPTCVVVASPDQQLAGKVQEIFMERSFRVYTSRDVLGVELGAALKNVVAIAAGVSDGLGFGSNTKAALLSRGLVEIIRLGVKMGGDPNTFFGLSGLGDLITTSISSYGRNRKVGELLGQGKKLEEILAGMEMVAEGIETSKSALALAEKYNVEMPIVREVYKILYENKDPFQAVEDLMLRDAKAETAC